MEMLQVRRVVAQSTEIESLVAHLKGVDVRRMA